MIWAILGVMLLIAAAAVVWPLSQYKKAVSPASIVAVVFIGAMSGSMYHFIGTPGGESATPELAGIEEMVAGLDARMRQNPDDLAGWKMLGRSYSQLGQYDEAIEAFEHAVELESATDGQTLVDLGEAIWMRDQRSVTGRASELFENALAVSPGNPKALFYGGLAAIERGERFLAADRWEALLATSPPEDIRGVLRQRIAELRGEEAPVQEAPAAAIVAAAIELAPVLSGSLDPDTVVFVIARDPSQPRPPIAVVRRRVADLPATIALSDADAMMQNRPLSALSEIEIVARVSQSGQPTAQSGDWYGQVTVRPTETGSVSLVIDTAVP
jgi:cytochrome c-type biogenesis protein CcmH